MKNKFKPSHKPWIGNLAWVIMLPIYMWLTWQYLFIKYNTLATIGLCVFALAFTWNLSRLNARVHGQGVEKKALSKLSSLLGDRCTVNVPLPRGGDADAVIVAADGTRINVEIKSITRIDRVKKANLRQVRSAASQLKSLPLIWLPRGTDNHGKHFEDVVVFSGNARALANYIGA